MHALAIEHHCPILAAIHLNPGSDFKTRGHLGSQLERKAESNLKLERDGDIIILFATRNRKAPISKDHGPRFQWSMEHHRHVSADSIGTIKHAANLEQLREQRDEAFRISGKSALYWKEIRDALQQVPGIKSDSKADRTLRDLKTHALVTFNILKQYVKP